MWPGAGNVVEPGLQGDAHGVGVLQANDAGQGGAVVWLGECQAADGHGAAGGVGGKPDALRPIELLAGFPIAEALCFQVMNGDW